MHRKLLERGQPLLICPPLQLVSYMHCEWDFSVVSPFQSKKVSQHERAEGRVVHVGRNGPVREQRRLGVGPLVSVVDIPDAIQERPGERSDQAQLAALRHFPAAVDAETWPDAPKIVGNVFSRGQRVWRIGPLGVNRLLDDRGFQTKRRANEYRIAEGEFVPRLEVEGVEVDTPIDALRW